MKTEIKTEKILLTPKLAKDFLDNSIKINRRLYSTTVNNYARQMSLGQWKFNPQSPITFNENSQMNNGQHRCHAVIQSNTPIEVLVCYGVNDDVLDVMDCGKSRNMEDRLRVAGFPDVSRWSTALTTVWKYENGLLRQRKINPSIQECVELFLSVPAGIMMRADYFGNIVRKSKVLPASAGIALWIILAKVNLSLAVQFMESLALGNNLDIKSQIKILRDRLLIGRAKYERLTPAEAISAVIYVWNAWRGNKQLTRINITEIYKRNIKAI